MVKHGISDATVGKLLDSFKLAAGLVGECFEFVHTIMKIENELSKCVTKI